MKKYIIPSCLFFLLFVVDQGTKWLAYHVLRGRGSIPLLGDIFVLQYLENRGAAFGMLQNQRIFLVCLTLVILAAFLVAYIKIFSHIKYFFPKFLLVVLAAGAAGNLWDRIVRGYVIDFLYFKWINFPVFNIADCYVVIAAIGIALFMCFYEQEEE
jgi:signal peptidase II